MTGYLLGVDAGQTATKAVLFDLTGRAVAVGAARCPTVSPRPRWVERDLNEVWRAAGEAIRGCLGEIDPGQVLAVAVVGHNDGLYAVDAAGEPVRPGITAMDSRAHQEVQRWRTAGIFEELLALTGQVPFEASPSALLAHLSAHEPQVLESARWLLFCKDWLRLRLTGEIATDRTEASASFCEVRSGQYSERALELFGLNGIRDKLPPIRGCAEVVGEVTAEAAGFTGLRAGTPVVTGAHDVDAAAVGDGVLSAGQLSLVAGTFSINQVISDAVAVDPRWQARAFLLPGRWLNMSTSPASATNLDWLLRTVIGPVPHEQIDAEIGEVLAERSDVVFHPFLYGSPHGPEASASFLGLRGWHTRGHLLRALYQGVVCNHRTHVGALREAFPMHGTARLSGGGARSSVWPQLFADGLGVDVEITDTEEAGARGAAVLAGIGVGVWPDLDSAVADTVRVRRRFTVDPIGAERFDSHYQRYLDLIGALTPVWTS
ncbi:FGGY-family carbohydrate kinase [Kutzneria viridogrisea]|uniref:L-xylulokinase n=1 Tax=Kutzneria viridogrisea TaxID=47990 RepID=A0ABR6BK70_9PSEU|nr:L-xylulokinase [Kutzneria viridogrisea]